MTDDELVEFGSQPRPRRSPLTKLTLSFNREDMDSLVTKMNEIIERVNQVEL